VQFYEGSAFLVEVVRVYLANGLRLGEGLVVCATPEHWEGVRRGLQAGGPELAEAERGGRVHAFDANETLARLMPEGVVDERAFRGIVEARVVALQARVAPSGVRIFGEMVDLLWQRGELKEAATLERLWNELLGRQRATLLCAYRMSAGHTGEHAAAIGGLCDAHDQVTPAETSGSVADDTDRRRTLTLLQQHARALAHEIEQRKELEETLRRRDAELAEADRRKDDFLALLGHELRNPMAAITAALHVVRAGRPEAGVRAQAVIERQTAKMARLIDDLLDVTRIRHGKMTLTREPVSVAVMVERVVDAVRAPIELRKQHLTVEVEAAPLFVQGDPGRLDQALTNLLLNATRYTPVGGNIAVRVRREADDVVIAVEDDGRGMPAELIERVFEPFVQGQPYGAAPDSGLGLGLSLVRGIVALHGGRVEARSNGSDRGSTFVARLPACAPPPSAVAEPAREAPSLRARSVLVVEDNVDAARMLAEALQELGHEVRVAHDGDAALVAAGCFHPETALVDIALPGVDGYEVARRLRAQTGGRALLLIALTGFGQEADRASAERAGFDRHLVKPVDPTRLHALLSG
jgi:signal transduction histidine kinase